MLTSASRSAAIRSRRPAWIYLSKKWYDEAVADFDRAIELRPDLDWAIASRGEARRQMARYAEALVDFDRALEIDPNLDYVIAWRELTLAAMSASQ
jgi:tetratricopeptide (TPR) repeat protein